MVINLIFRSKLRKEFSIENVFGFIEDDLSKDNEVVKSYLPSGRYNSFSDLQQNIRYAKNFEGDIHHITGEVHFLVPFLKSKDTVLTIHDLVMVENSTGIKKILYKLFWLYIPIKLAGEVTCISEKTKDDILKLFPNIEKKISVIPDPYSPIFSPNEKNDKADVPVILAMGTRSNKNLERIIQATKGLKCKLLIVGRLSDQQKVMLQDNKITYENKFNISNDEIYECYCQCDFLCFPSLYEGFGMPIIEAQAVGRPVITSSWRPMSDIAGDGALLVDPESVDEIRRAIITLIENKDMRKNLVAEGFANVKYYHPETVADMYLDVYNKLKGKKNNECGTDVSNEKTGC